MSSTLHFIGDSTAVDSVDIQRPSSDYSTSDSRCATSAGSGLSSKKLNGFGLLTPALTVVPNLNVVGCESGILYVHECLRTRVY